MPNLPKLKLNHVGIPSRNPLKLAKWYAKHFKLMLDGPFAYGDGWLIACEDGEPLTDTIAHFGFMLSTKNEVTQWTDYLVSEGVEVEVQRQGNAVFIKDPEGNSFEFFWDPTEVKLPVA